MDRHLIPGRRDRVASGGTGPIERRTIVAGHVRRVLEKLSLPRIVLSYLVVCAVALPWHLHRVSPDASAYLTIARKYAALNFEEAVNGYWSPLFSWLLAPLLCLGFATEVAGRCLDVAIGAGAIAATWWLARRLKQSPVVCAMTSLAMVGPVAMYALKDTPADLLVACLLVIYVGVLVGEDYPRSPWQGAACGLLGALAFLAKAYALPFFLAHYSAVSLYLVVRRRGVHDDRRKLVGATAAGLFVFAVVAGAWAGVLSRKYDRWTFGTTGAYQLRVIAPGSIGNPLDRGGLYPPSNATAVSAWEDPSDLRAPAFATARPRSPRPAIVRPPARLPTPSPPAPEAARAKVAPTGAVSWSRVVGNQVLRYLFNVVMLCGVLFRLTPLWPLIFAGLCVACWQRRGKVRDRCVILLGTLLLYPSGYLLIFIVPRYFWIMTFLLAAAAFLLPKVLFMPRAKRWATAWNVAILVSFLLWPTWIMARTWHHVLERVATLAEQLHDAVPPGSRLASDAEFGISNSLAYHLGAHYHGLLRPGGTNDEHERQLREQHVGYVLIWGDPAAHPFLASARELPSQPFVEARLGQVPRLFMLGDTIR